MATKPSKKKQRAIWAEMARRKVKFYKDTEWYKIRLWGLFSWGDVSWLIEQGLLLTEMRRENRTVWVWPSEDIWVEHIEPLVASMTEDELSLMAGRDPGAVLSQYELSPW